MKPIALAAIVAGAFLATPAASALDKVTFATNWKAQAAHGGFYQALADGTYRKYGLDVRILQGGPQVNNAALLPAGRVDFLMTGNLLHSFDGVRNGLPNIVVAAIFQKDPQALIAHPGQGYEKFESLRNAPVALIAKDAQFSWWQWLKVRHGFRDEMLRPYNYNLGPFLANKRALQQGYSVAEPIYVLKQGGWSRTHGRAKGGELQPGRRRLHDPPDHQALAPAAHLLFFRFPLRGLGRKVAPRGQPMTELFLGRGLVGQVVFEGECYCCVSEIALQSL